MLLKGRPTSTTLSESDFESESECEFESDNLNIWIWSDHSSDCDNMWYDEYDTASKLKIESEFGSESESNWVVSLKLNVSLTEYLWWSDCGSTIFENQSSIWLVAHWLSYWIMCQCKCFTTWIPCGWLLILINVVLKFEPYFVGHGWLSSVWHLNLQLLNPRYIVIQTSQRNLASSLETRARKACTCTCNVVHACVCCNLVQT